MSEADLEVEGVVGRGDLDGSRSEFELDTLIRHHRDLPVEDREKQRLPDRVLVSLIVWMHRNSGIAEHRLGPRRGDRDVTGPVLERVPDVGQFTRVVLVLDLDLGQGGVASWAPVDDPVGAIHEPLLVQRHEDLPDRFAQALVEREPLP